MKEDNKQYINWFRHSSPYINAHRGKTFVIFISGEAVADANFYNVVHDLTLLSSLGIRLVLVHGARPQIEQELADKGISAEFSDDIRVTSNALLPAIIKASASVRVQIEAMLSMGVANSPMHGAKIQVSSGNYVVAKPLGVINGVDFHHSGEVRNIETKSVENLLDAGHIVLLSNLGYSPTGECFNLRAEHVATEAAIQLQANKAIYFSASDGCINEAGELLRELNASEIVSSLNDEQNFLFKNASKACVNKVERGHIISFKNDGALLQELFTRDGSGTLISEKPYEIIREASIEDVGGIIELIRPLEEQGILLKRSRELLENEISNFSIIERDETIIACAALYTYDDAKAAELACISVHPDYRDGKRGDALLNHLQKKAKKASIDSIFVLTTQTAHWFQERNFKEANKEDLPEEKKDLYNYQRNSKIFVKKIT